MQTEPKAISMLAACLGRITLAEGFLWTMAAIFFGKETAAAMSPGPVLAAGTAGFLINHLLLRKDRSLLLMLLLNLAMVLGGAWMLGHRSLAAVICVAIGLGLGLFSVLCWETGRFRDETMIWDLQILLVCGVWQLWLTGQIAAESSWIWVTFLVIGLLLAGLLASKLSGLSPVSDRGRSRVLRKILPAIFLLSACGLVFSGAGVLTEPVGRILHGGYAATEGLRQAALSALTAILTFLFRGKKVRTEAGMEASGGMGEDVILEDFGGGEGFDIILMIFYAAIAAVLAMLVITLLRALLQMTVGAGRKVRRKAAGSAEADGTFMEHLRAWLREVLCQIRGKRVLRQNPSSVAALLVFLEETCARNPQLQRRPGESARQFLCRLADYAEGISPGMGEILLKLADEADQACYSRDGNLLAEYTESGTIRSFFRENP